MSKGTIEPMRPARRTQVPLWLALILRKSTGCQIVPPSWFTVGALTSLLQEEQNNENYQPVDFHYIEIATLLLEKY